MKHWPMWTIARRCTALLFVALLVVASRRHVELVTGSTTATRFGDIAPFADPLAALEAMLASRSATVDVLIGAGLLLAFAALFGPVFCGWVCPLGLLLDVNDSLRRRVRRLLRRPALAPRRGAHAATVRWAVLGIVLGFAVVAAIPLFQVLSPINLIGHLVAIGGPLAPTLIVLGVLVVMEWIWPRLWCRVWCPLGALYSLVGGLAVWRVRINEEELGRQPCMQCTLNCPMGIRVMQDYAIKQRPFVDDPACTRCGACIDACPGGVLSLGFRPKSHQARSLQ